jgi:division/cell wall cluster transcriptional repressor MraZ
MTSSPSAPAPAGGVSELLFFGNSEHKLDGKNRVHVPKRFREPSAATGGGSEGVSFAQFFVIPWEADGCVWLLTRQQFQSHASFVPRESIAGADAARNRQVQRSFFQSVEVVDVDVQGRITLSSEMMRNIFGADLPSEEERKVQMVGAGDRAEIWSVARWHAQNGRPAA